MAGPLETALVEAFNAMKEDLRKLLLQETPFTDGILPIAAGGTGEITAGAALAALGGVAAGHTHAGADITSGTVAAARLGSGASATTTLHGDSTFSLVDIVAETTGTLSIARGGTGQTSAAAALSALGGVGPSHSHAGADITSGTVAAARLGSGTPSATTLLWGDSTWAALVAADIPNLAASIITSGTLAAARGGTGVSNAGTLTLGQNVTFNGGGTTTISVAGSYTFTIPGTGTAVIGTGSTARIPYFTNANTIDDAADLIWTNSGAILRINSGGALGVAMGSQPTHTLQLGTDDAAKTSTTLWSTTCDERTKDEIEDYTEGLAYLESLPTIKTFLYNGRFGSVAGVRGVNFIAQEMELADPSWIIRREVKEYDSDPDGSEVEILKQNNHKLIFAHHNAILELAAAVRSLTKG